MKRTIFYVCFLAFATIVASCSKEKKPVEDTQVLDEWPDAPKPLPGVQSLGTVTDSCTFSLGDKQFMAVISRIINEEDTVFAGDGNKYFDTTYKLQVSSGGSVVMTRNFRKNDFRNYIDNNYIDLSKSLISQLILGQTNETIATFFATIEMPGMSKEMPVKIDMDRSGGIVMSRYEEDVEEIHAEEDYNNFEADGI